MIRSLVSHVERRKQRGRPVPLVVVRAMSPGSRTSNYAVRDISVRVVSCPFRSLRGIRKVFRVPFRIELLSVPTVLSISSRGAKEAERLAALEAAISDR